MSRRGRGVGRRESGSVIVTPLTLFGSALKLWLRADMGITLNGSNVSAWADQSGQGDTNRNAVQGTAASQPLFVSSDAAYGSKPVLSFDGVDDFLRTGTWSAALTQPCAWYCVCDSDGTGTNRLVIDGIDGSNRQIVEYSGAVATRYDIYAGVGLADSAAADGNPHIVGGLFNGVSSKIYVDNITEKATGNASANSLAGVTIGGSFVATAIWAGRIAEVIAVSGTPSAAQHASVMRYLGFRYGITVGA